MDMRKVIAASVVVIMMAAILFSSASNVLDSAEGNITDKGDQENEKAKCIFANPSESSNCLEPTTYKNQLPHHTREKLQLSI